MSNLSIYEDLWINMVFEGKNKEYGAYKLRHDSNRTMLKAFLISILLVSSITSIYMIANYFNLSKSVRNTEIIAPDVIIQVTNIKPIEPKKPIQMILPISKKADVIKKEQLSNIEIVKPIDATNNIVLTNESNSSNIQNINANSTIIATNKSITVETYIPSLPHNETKIITTNLLDKLPEFPGGIAKFYNYVGNNFEKPEFDVVTTVKIYVSFVIEKDGSMTDIQVKRDPGYGLSREAIRVLKSLKTKWIPGVMNGEPVRTSYNLPIVVEMR